MTAGPVPESQALQSDYLDRDYSNPSPSEFAFGFPLKKGTDFSASNFADIQDAARFKALDLSTPQAVRRMPGDRFGGELSFSASAAQTGLGLDVEFAPRAQIQVDRAGATVSRTGAEVRFGPDLSLSDRDLRRKGVSRPSWYFFVGADNEALIWNVADQNSVNGLTINNQATIGDLQVGVAWAMFGGQMSFGVVERELRYNDLTGDHDVERKDHFAAFSFTLRQ